MSGEGSSPTRTAVLLEASRAVYVEVPKVACSSIKVRSVHSALTWLRAAECMARH